MNEHVPCAATALVRIRPTECIGWRSPPAPKPPRVTAARILAAGGLTAATLGTVGGFVGATWLIRLANAVMLVANLAVLSGRWR